MTTRVLLRAAGFGGEATSPGAQGPGPGPREQGEAGVEGCSPARTARCGGVSGGWGDAAWRRCRPPTGRCTGGRAPSSTTCPLAIGCGSRRTLLPQLAPERGGSQEAALCCPLGSIAGGSAQSALIEHLKCPRYFPRARPTNTRRSCARPTVNSQLPQRRGDLWLQDHTGLHHQWL